MKSKIQKLKCITQQSCALLAAAIDFYPLSGICCLRLRTPGLVAASKAGSAFERSSGRSYPAGIWHERVAVGKLFSKGHLSAPQCSGCCADGSSAHLFLTVVLLLCHSHSCKVGFGICCCSYPKASACCSRPSAGSASTGCRSPGTAGTLSHSGWGSSRWSFSCSLCLLTDCC